MKVIFNSDILYHTYLIRGRLKKGLQKLADVCASLDHSIVLPLTAQFEFDRSQKQFIDKEVEPIEEAYRVLDHYGIAHDEPDPYSVVSPPPNLVELFEQHGVAVSVVAPSIDDFNEAHRRACLHENPHPPDIKSDEMRDLVIWTIALRLASENGGALLLSRDTVHVHPRGDDEARRVRLVRAESIDDALEYFEVETPTGKLIKSLLTPVWEDIVERGLPAVMPMSIKGVSHPRFRQGTELPEFASCTVKAQAPGGKTVSAHLELHLAGTEITEVVVSEIQLDGDRVPDLPSFNPRKHVPVEGQDYEERIRSLRDIIGG